ncbi:hypothetical protein OAL72_00330 [bacterium]|nr:hypothetical protein [bacterium]
MIIYKTLKHLGAERIFTKVWVQKLLRWVRYKTKLESRLRRQLSFDKGGIVNQPYTGKRVLVPIIETDHYQHQHMLGLAKALQLRGADIKVLICGEVLDGCEIKSVRKVGDPDPCWSCRFHAQKTLPHYGLDTCSLADLVPPAELIRIRNMASEKVKKGESISHYGIELDQAIRDSIIRYYYGSVPAEQNQQEHVRTAYTASALISSEAANKIKETWNPDIILSNQWVYSYQWPFYKMFNYRLVNSSSFDFTKIHFNLPDLFGKKDRFRSYMASRTDKKLNKKELDHLRKYIFNRMTGSTPKSELYGYFSDFKNDYTEKIIDIDKNKRNIFLFTNIYWDAGLSENADFYNGVVDWTFRTIELLNGRDDVCLYIKPHPGELFDSVSSLKGVGQMVNEKYPVLPSNIKLIRPEWKVNTYSLFKYIDLGVIYTGTLGLEMLLSGIPVVSTGLTSHYNLGFAAEPKTEEEYLKLLIGQKDTPKYDLDELESFAYFYFIRCGMPWTLTKESYGDDFDGFLIKSLDDLLPGKNPQLDHLCNCIMDLDNTTVEAWPALNDTDKS